MSAPAELKLLRSVKTGKGLKKLIASLRQQRKANKIGSSRKALTKTQRESILLKTDKRCHICGIKLEANNFHADHVIAHITGGAHSENNYLPCCPTCNFLRWHHNSEEIQLMMKLGRWIKSELEKDSSLSLDIANAFMKHEMGLRKRRKKNPINSRKVSRTLHSI